MSKLSKEQVEHIARLSRIKLTAEEVEKFSVEISSILDYVELLNEVNTDGVGSIAQINGFENVASDDAIVGHHIPREELLANAPETQSGFIKVKPVFEERESI